MHRNAGVMLVGLLAALVVAAPAAAQAPVVKSVVKKVPVREGKVTESKVGCPGGMAAIAGSVVKHPSGSTLRRSLPSGATLWRFAFAGYQSAKSHRATVVVRCVGLDVPTAAGKVKLNVNTVSGALSVDALARGETKLSCRKGYIATDWGFNIPAPDTSTQNVAPPEELQVFKALASSGAYSFGVENIGAADQGLQLRIRCLERTVAGKAGLSHRWRIKRARASDRIGGGLKTVSQSCSKGLVSIGRGHSIDPAGDVVFRRSYTRGRRSARWVFANAGGRDSVTTQLSCLKPSTSFR